MSKFSKQQECLKQLHDLAHIAVNGQTDSKEPLYYDFLNPLLALEEIITPWHIRLWSKVYNKYLWKLRFRKTDIPF